MANSSTSDNALRHAIIRYLAVLAICIGGLTAWGVFAQRLHQHRTHGATSTTTISPLEAFVRTVPSSIANTAIVNEHGQTTSLRALNGRTVVLADTMTSCQEECPITTGALLSVYHSLQQQHVLNRVEIVELSVDPQRDTPARLTAYAKMADVPFELATGTKSNLAKIWKWFGVSYWRVKEGSPPSIDWYTHKPYTYDIDHSDDVFILGPSGKLRYVVNGDANVNGSLSKSLHNLLDNEGEMDLRSPGTGSWTPAELLQSISTVIKTPIK